MSELILAEFPPVCRDCGCPQHSIEQSRLNGTTYPLYTCWNSDCLLYAVTLTAEQHARMSETELEAYRMMNRDRVEV